MNIARIKVTEQDRQSFKDNPLDEGITAHLATLYTKQGKIDANWYWVDFGMSHGVFWLKYWRVKQKWITY